MAAGALGRETGCFGHGSMGFLLSACRPGGLPPSCQVSRCHGESRRLLTCQDVADRAINYPRPAHLPLLPSRSELPSSWSPPDDNSCIEVASARSQAMPCVP